MLSSLSLPKYVSRGGEKLQSAIEHWNIDVKGAVCLDLGASAGGFTDCLLQNGASKVTAVDVGYGQFHPKLRNDPRVQLYERTNVMNWHPDSSFVIPAEARIQSSSPLFITIDLSFISLKKVLPKVLQLFSSSIPLSLLILFKPQFEVEPKNAPKGVVKDEDVRESAVQDILDFCSTLGLEILGHIPCPVLGPKGNQEEWLYCSAVIPANPSSFRRKPESSSLI